MKLPHRRFLAYHVILGLDDVQIRHLAEADGLVVPEVAELARLRYELADRPKTFNAFDPDDKPSTIWLVRQGIHGLVRGDAAAREAVSVLRSADRRHPIEILLTGGLSPNDVVRFVKERDLPEVSSEGVKEFGRLLWDVTSTGLDDLVTYFERCALGDVHRNALAGGDKAIAVADAFVARNKRQLTTRLR